MTDDLIAFIKARLDEDESAAQAAHPGPWDYETEVGGFGPVGCVMMPLGNHKGVRTGLTAFTPLGTQDADTAAHIARHDPARVLREVAAKRRMLAEVVPQIIDMDRAIDGEWGLGEKAPDEHWPLLKLLALPYSDHPDYRDEWRP